MVKLCIFDLDGTVLDTLQTIAYYGNLALEKNGIQPIPVREYRYLAGTGAGNLVHKMLQYRCCDTQPVFEKVFRDYNEAYNADVTCRSAIFPGLREALDAIREAGISLSIVSNKPDFAAKHVVSKLYGDGYFTRVVGQREGVALKPDPGAVIEVMKEQGVSSEECLYFGDTSTDMQTGKNAGIFTVGVLWGFRDREELLENGADLLLERPEEICSFVLSRN